MQAFLYGKTIFTQVLIMAVLISLGYFITKAKKLSILTVKEITFLVFHIVTPCVIINAFLNVDFNYYYIKSMMMAAILALLSHLLGYLSGFIFLKVKPYEKQVIYRFGAMISNAGFMALPLAQALLGSEGVILVSVYVIMVNIFNWTLGRSLFKSEQKISRIKTILNPGTIGVLIGILAVLMKNIYMPTVITISVSYLSSLNTPLAMIVTGYYLVGTNVLKCITDINSWYVILLRQILLPLSLMLLYHFVFDISGILLICVILPVSAPCAVIVIMFSSMFGGDEKTATQMVSLSTITSILTMPMVLIISKYFSLL